MRYLRAIALLGLVVGAGCGGPTEPSEPSFTFAVSRVFGVRRSPPVVNAGEASIAIHGIFEAPHPRFTVTGWLVQPEPRVLQLGVRGNADGPAQEVASLHLYQSRIGRLAKGLYQLQIYYVVLQGALRDSVLAFTTNVQVR